MTQPGATHGGNAGPGFPRPLGARRGDAVSRPGRGSRVLLALLVLLVWRTPAPLTASAESLQRPRVAVALAGGGAWGFAHAGVLTTIEELGIPVDIVTGTSIGSIVGAFYAAGYTAEQLVAIAETTHWNDVLFDTTDRLQLGYADRRQRRSFRASVGFREGEILLRGGASSAQRVVQYLDDLLRYHALTDSFAEMPRSLAIIAADLVTGEEVVYTEGDLKSAIRASISVPGVFTPAYYRGRYLIDGGWVNNIPVDAARRLGADIVIAVNLNVMDRQPEDLQSVGPILDQAARILRQESITRNLEQADLVITPDLTGILPTDFQRAQTLVQRGRNAGEERREDLEKLARRVREHRAAPASLPPARPERDRPVTLTGARYEIPEDKRTVAHEFDVLSVELLEDLVDRLRGTETTVAEVQNAVYSLYDTGYYEYISYEIENQRDLVVYAIPREHARSTLALGIGFRAQILENAIGMGLAHVRYTYDRGESRPRWIAEGWLSRTAGARFALEIPLPTNMHLVPAVYALGENMPFFDDRSVESFYVRRRFGGELGLSLYRGRSWDISAAGFSEWLALQRLDGAEVFDFDGTSRHGGRLQVWRDTLDRDLFPRGGSETSITYRVHWDSEQEHWAHLVNGATRRYWSPWRRVTLRGLARAGSDVLSGVAVYERFFLGGVESWYGYYYQELQARHFGVGGGDVRVKLGTLPIGVGRGGYAVTGAQVGGTHTGALEDTIDEFDVRFGLHGGLAFDTVVGALHVGIAVNDEGRVMSFIELGPAYTPGGTGYDW